MRGLLNREFFEFIEQQGKAGVTSRQMADKFGVSRVHMRVFLSKYTNVRQPDGTLKHYLIYRPPKPNSVRGGKNIVLGTYITGPDEWSEMLVRRRSSR